MQQLFALAETDGYRVFILGARQEVLDTATRRLRQRHPQLAIAGRR